MLITVTREMRVLITVIRHLSYLIHVVVSRVKEPNPLPPPSLIRHLFKLTTYCLCFDLKVPTKASPFVNNVLRSVRDFLDQNQLYVSQSQRQAWAAAIMQTLLSK